MISTHPVSNTHPIPYSHPVLNHTTRTNDYTQTIPKCHLPISSSTPPQYKSFEDILASSNLPPPGPDYYAARRALWLTPHSPTVPHTPELSTSRQRLEKLLRSPGAVESKQVWDSGIEKVWKGLASGGRLKRRLPMALIIKITHAAWLRDQTWPAGALAPESDDILLDNEAIPITSTQAPFPVPLTVTEYSSGATTPWTIVNNDGGKFANDESASGTASRT